MTAVTRYRCRRHSVSMTASPRFHPGGRWGGSRRASTIIPHPRIPASTPHPPIRPPEPNAGGGYLPALPRWLGAAFPPFRTREEDGCARPFTLVWCLRFGRGGSPPAATLFPARWPRLALPPYQLSAPRRRATGNGVISAPDTSPLCTPATPPVPAPPPPAPAPMPGSPRGPLGCRGDWRL
uniref:Uncharacterized protein n=1 Tax=Candidatus Kentrum sp. DK TaxID=2126562 RepID=A0A450S8J8_9GAMM|nr:MAG: hypothetical protein BECKDK2373C_GA0170839_10218 [Candidatus Kentron sp. DK]